MLDIVLYAFFFVVTGWETVIPSNSSNAVNGFSYQQPLDSELGFSGFFATYSGGGYVAKFEGTYNDIPDWVDNLSANNWIDRYTRAVLVEFCVNNANVNVFSQVKIVFEMPAVGGIFTQYKLISFRPYPYVDAIDFVLLLAQIIWSIIIIYMTVQEIRQMVKLKCDYLKQTWNILDLVMIIAGYISMVFYGLRIHYIVQSVEDVKNEVGKCQH